MAIRTAAPETVLCEPRATRDGGRVVHVVNYDLEKRPAPFMLEVAVPPGRAVRRALWLDPESNGGEGVTLRHLVAEGWCGVEVPALDVYGLISLEFVDRETD
jgi:hypothetical protein